MSGIAKKQLTVCLFSGLGKLFVWFTLNSPTKARRRQHLSGLVYQNGFGLGIGL